MTYLTKSRYQLASECPRKLYYQDRPEQYPNKDSENEFLKALADGGHQVSALARTLYPEGIEITSADPDEAGEQTAKLLKRSDVIIFEAAIRYEQFYIRIDILRQTAGRIEILEVKAKSWDSTPGKMSMVNQNGAINAKWIEYLEDVAFQTWVARQVIRSQPIAPHLLLIDKSTTVNGDGLHQLFRIQRHGAKVSVQIMDAALARDLGKTVLIPVDVGIHVDAIIAGTAKIAAGKTDACGPGLPDRARLFARYQSLKNLMPEKAPIGMGCKSCEFRADPGEVTSGKLSGVDQCWHERLGDRHRPDRAPLYSLWNLNAATGNKLMEKDDIYYLDEMTIDHLKRGNVRMERQIVSVTTKDSKEEIAPEIGEEIKKWVYPIHFLDFETATPALPFHRGMRPYQLVAFQFSCHHLHANGSLTHDEFIATEPGEFPSWKFLRALHEVLGRDQGTILRYAAHENTVLRALRRQMLEASKDQSGKFQPIAANFDVDGLARWIDQITTTGPKDEREGIAGPRTMVDLLPMVKNHYYHPRQGKSNSIKQVLPAVMTAGAALRDRYQRPLDFGTNLKGHVLWQAGPDGETPRDPYDLLLPVLPDIPPDLLEDEFNEDGIQTGGAAMMAYASMQYTDMSSEQRQTLKAALLRYCELDTLAMLMIVQHWKHALRMG